MSGPFLCHNLPVSRNIYLQISKECNYFVTRSKKDVGCRQIKERLGRTVLSIDTFQEGFAHYTSLSDKTGHLHKLFIIYTRHLVYILIHTSEIEY